MRTPVTLTRDRTFHQRRLRDAVKRLVIEALQQRDVALEQGLQDVHVQTAAAGIDTAILLRSGFANDCLNEPQAR